MFIWKIQLLKAIALGVGILLGTVSTAVAQDKEPAATGDGYTTEDAFVLGPGDRIAVFVWKQPTISTEITVAPDGTISYPLIGEFRAAGRTLSEFQKVVSKKLALHLREPQVTATLQEAASYRIYVLGEVVRPGVFQLIGPVTVVHAVSMAGGFTPFASPENIIVHNPYLEHGRRYRFDYNKFISTKGEVEGSVSRCLPAGKAATQNQVERGEIPAFCLQRHLLRPGDIVIVN